LTIPDSADTRLTAEQATQVRGLFEQGKGCSHCGGAHARACPRVRRMVFHPDGRLAEVEFWAEGRWSDAHVLWPEDVAPAGD